MAARLFFLFLCLCRASSGDVYSVYFLEKSCLSGHLNISMTESGPSSSGILRATSNLEMECKVLLLAPPQHLVVVSLREVDFRTNLRRGCKDYLEVDGEQICEAIDRDDEERHYLSSSNVMRLLYYTSPDGLSGNPRFTLTFTALSKAGRNCTGVDRFLCGNDLCIWSGWTCDGHNNCGDRSDEEVHGNSKCGRSGSSVLIVLAVLIVFVLLLICVATLLCTKNETVRRFSTRLRSRTLSFIPKIR